MSSQDKFVIRAVISVMRDDYLLLTRDEKANIFSIKPSAYFVSSKINSYYEEELIRRVFTFKRFYTDHLCTRFF